MKLKEFFTNFPLTLKATIILLTLAIGAFSTGKVWKLLQKFLKARRTQTKVITDEGNAVINRKNPTGLVSSNKVLPKRTYNKKVKEYIGFLEDFEKKYLK